MLCGRLFEQHSLVDERELFRTRVGALAGALQRAWPRGTGYAGDGSVEADLHTWVAARVRLRVENLQGQVAALEAALDGGQRLDLCWRGYEAATLACEPLFEECLAVRQGVIAREAQLDSGICAIADRLLAEICEDADISWRRFTVLGAAEAYTHLTDVIRVRFPDLSVWDLPVAAHELGHHAAMKLERPTQGLAQSPFRELVAALPDECEQALEEYFADAFAALTVGPAYTCTCLLMRFEPHAAGEDGTPAPDRDRAYVLLGVLRRAVAEGVRTHEAHASAKLDQVAHLWDASFRATHGDGAPQADERLDRLVARLYAKLREALPSSARYRDSVHERARELAPKLLGPNYMAGPDAGGTVVEALNGAWLAHLEAGPDSGLRGRVTRNARRLMDALLGPVPAGSAT